MNCVYCSGLLNPFSTRKTESVNDYSLTDRLRRDLPEIIYGKCIDCESIIATDARMQSEKDLLNSYENLPEDYWQNIQAEEHKTFFQEVENSLNPARSKFKICDVGCGNGHFLSSLGTHWQKFGVEPGKLAANVSKRQEIQYFHGVLKQSPFPNNTMDIITYVDVFEHLMNPVQEIKVAKEFLAPNGKLFIYTADASSLFAKLSGKTWLYLKCIGHIAVPSRKGLISALQSSGFSKIEVHKHNHPSSTNFLRWISYLIASKILGNRGSIPLFHDHMLVIASV
jgi:2-polyprenyl-3-methyl-5-hydroxy-6-metoxy-1,4-benzoquinol methylase